MNKFLKEFKDRGYFYQCTSEEELSKLLDKVMGFQFGDDVTYNRARLHTQRTRYQTEEQKVAEDKESKVVVHDGTEDESEAKKKSKESKKKDKDDNGKSDVAEAAGPLGQVVLRKFEGIEVVENLTVELIPVNATNAKVAPTVIQTLEVNREQIQAAN